jgi:DNA-directed RNA polymerase subunit RPC12/RpoP
MKKGGWPGNPDFGGLISVEEGSQGGVSEEKKSWGATRVSLEPALKCGACGSRILIMDYCSKTFADTPMASNEVVSFVRENLQDLSCSRCGERRVQLVWIGRPH